MARAFACKNKEKQQEKQKTLLRRGNYFVTT
jgi:hypothetical protein